MENWCLQYCHEIYLQTEALTITREYCREGNEHFHCLNIKKQRVNKHGYLRYSRVHSRLSSPLRRKAVPSACCCTSCRWSTPRGRPGPWPCSQCLPQQHSPRSGHSGLSPEGRDMGQCKLPSSTAKRVLLHVYAENPKIVLLLVLLTVTILRNLSPRCKPSSYHLTQLYSHPQLLS